MKRDFALILPNKGTGEHDVMTITIFDNPTEANMVSRAIYGETAYAIESSMWNVQLPAIYKEGTFQNIKSKDARDEKGNLISVRTGEEQAERIPTQVEQIAELRRQNEALKRAVDDLVLDTLGGE
jgi:hypothetical protein|nr:MAG TPA: hypothetical protein [Caudoviricetes sp.]